MAVVTFGPFISRQVNVDGAGNNTIGDAANEPSLAIDPTNPNRIVIAWRQFDTIASNFRQAGVAYSHDLGLTWTATTLDPGQFRSDPVLGTDNNGTFFFSSLSSITTIEMFRSLDGGVTWSFPPVPAFGGDKQWIAID
ncbi:MAG: exo-alpha-sialidase, partial [Proteobacteria bacterium]|nr:exo-alpha-sialidase [Pseudomonadota bacterium]